MGKGDNQKVLNFEFWQSHQVDKEYFTSDKSLIIFGVDLMLFG